MSGGYFDYYQYHIEQVADKLEVAIEQYKEDLNEETIDEFEATLIMLRICQKSVHRIDWLLSGDDSEATFHERLHEELSKLTRKNDEQV
jgi:hypothetical protein